MNGFQACYSSSGCWKPDLRAARTLISKVEGSDGIGWTQGTSDRLYSEVCGGTVSAKDVLQIHNCLPEALVSKCHGSTTKSSRTLNLNSHYSHTPHSNKLRLTDPRLIGRICKLGAYAKSYYQSSRGNPNHRAQRIPSRKWQHKLRQGHSMPSLFLQVWCRKLSKFELVHSSGISISGR
jgi:hypothetical protein